MGHPHGVDVSGEVEVDLLHGKDLGVASSCSPSLDPEAGPERGFPKAQHGALALAHQGLSEADGDGGLAFPRRGGGGGGDEDQFPLGTILQGYPKVVRDLCRLLGKEAALTVSGEDTPMDKRILEGLKDPLLHLLRNGVDHGLEPPEERLRQGKPPAGNLSLRVHRQEGNRVEIVLSDDGRGIDPRALRQSAVKAGVLSSQDAEALDDAAALGLLFRSGVSTSPLVTDISGRGLGMAIVEEGVQKLGGSVTVRSVPGAGTTFLLSLPLTLATFRGLLVREGGRSFLVPTGSILSCWTGRVASIITILIFGST